MKHYIRWVLGNAKLQKTGAIGFGLPAYRSSSGFAVCPGAGTCAAVCYARQGTYTWPATVAAREANLAYVREDLAGFEREAIAYLLNKAPRFVRIHDSGDFFSQAYLDAWYRIASTVPGVIFYAYTKSLHLELWKHKPDNFSLVQSQGGKWDAKIDIAKSHSRIFSTERDRLAAGYVQGNGAAGDRPAILEERKIGLVYHGVRKLTAPQVAAFA